MLQHEIIITMFRSTHLFSRFHQLVITHTNSIYFGGFYPATMELTYRFLNTIPTDFELVPVSPTTDFYGFVVLFSDICPILIRLPISSINRAFELCTQAEAYN